MRSAIDSKMTGVDMALSAVGSMSASGVVMKASRFVPNATSLSRGPIMFLSEPYWSEHLPLVYNVEKTQHLLDQLCNGVKIGRAAASVTVISPNWPSALEFHKAVTKVIDLDLAMGRLYGPFEIPDFDFYVVSPLGAFMKRDKSKIRLIHDLSYPPSCSVNSDIDPDDFSLQYSTVDDAVVCCTKFQAPYMSKLDLKDAYKHIGVHPDDWHLLGFQWSSIADSPQFYFS